MPGFKQAFCLMDIERIDVAVNGVIASIHYTLKLSIPRRTLVY